MCIEPLAWDCTLKCLHMTKQFHMLEQLDYFNNHKICLHKCPLEIKHGPLIQDVWFLIYCKIWKFLNTIAHLIPTIWNH
jgi:hypothetical protein